MNVYIRWHVYASSHNRSLLNSLVPGYHEWSMCRPLALLKEKENVKEKSPSVSVAIRCTSVSRLSGSRAASVACSPRPEPAATVVAAFVTTRVGRTPARSRTKGAPGALQRRRGPLPRVPTVMTPRSIVTRCSLKAAAGCDLGLHKISAGDDKNGPHARHRSRPHIVARGVTLCVRASFLPPIN